MFGGPFDLHLGDILDRAGHQVLDRLTHRRRTAQQAVDLPIDEPGERIAITSPSGGGLLGALGRYAIIASVGERRASFDILDFYHKRLRLIGVDSRALDSVAAARILDRLRPGFESGRLRAPHVAERFELARGVDAYRAVARGTPGKVLLTLTA